MAFNSYGFLLAFLPLLCCANHWVRRGASARQAVLLLFGTVFYAMGSLLSLPFLAGSLAVNFVLARQIHHAQGEARRRWTWAGVGLNVLSLVYIKYAAFLLGDWAVVWPFHLAGGGLFLPLGMSFFTFQQISFLVDVSRGTLQPPRLLTYAAGIVFFPCLLSGPIVYVREIAPQLDRPQDESEAGLDMTVGLGQFAIGLAKKAVVADTMALWVDPLFVATQAGGQPSLVQGWLMVTGYLLQMYFDFSGYSDMALGLGRMLGLRLPLNFYSPLRATSIIDWWRRWHMSLGRFVNDYIFQSLALPLTRWAMVRGASRWGVSAAGVLLPTALSMFVIGAWHGGRWTFIAFGALHALYMVAAELWRMVRGRKAAPLPVWLGNGLTILCVLVALAPFRADTMAAASRIWLGMAGMAGGAGVAWPFPGAAMAQLALAEVIAGLLFCYLLPNTGQLFIGHTPALPSPLFRQLPRARITLIWRPNIVWGLMLGMMLALGAIFVSRIGGQFVYFAF